MIMGGAGNQQWSIPTPIGSRIAIGADGFTATADGIGNPIIPGVGHRSITGVGSAMAATAGCGVRTPFGVPRGFHGGGPPGIADGLPCLRGRSGTPVMAGGTAEGTSESDSILGWASIVTHSSR